MAVIYVAGPYRGNVLRRLINVLRARRAALFVWQHGAVALCPHLNTAFFDGHAPDDVWLDGDIELLKRCDAVWLIEGWDRSVGALTEAAVAECLGLPRLTSREDVIAYLNAPLVTRDLHYTQWATQRETLAQGPSHVRPTE